MALHLRGGLCDGARHAVSITVAADSAGRPFKSGRAVVSAAGDASYFWWNNRTGREGYVDQWATTGWMPTRLHR